MKKYEINVYDENGHEEIELTRIRKEMLDKILDEHKEELVLKQNWETEYSDYILRGTQYIVRNYILFVWETEFKEVR